MWQVAKLDYFRVQRAAIQSQTRNFLSLQTFKHLRTNYNTVPWSNISGEKKKTQEEMDFTVRLWAYSLLWFDFHSQVVSYFILLYLNCCAEIVHSACLCFLLHSSNTLHSTPQFCPAPWYQNPSFSKNSPQKWSVASLWYPLGNSFSLYISLWHEIGGI